MTTAKSPALSAERNVFNGIRHPEEDGLPLPDGAEHEAYSRGVAPVLPAWLEQRYDAIVSGNVSLYYEEGNRRAAVSSDCCVTFGPTQDAILPHNSCFTWRLGRVPGFVLEIGSQGTARADSGPKPNFAVCGAKDDGAKDDGAKDDGAKDDPEELCLIFSW